MTNIDDKKNTEVSVESVNESENRGLFLQLWFFVWERKAFVLAPVIVLLLLVGVLVFVGQSSAVSPFIYALF